LDTYLYELKSIGEVAPSVFEMVVDPGGEAMSFQAGQYVNFLYPDGNAYPFSIASSPEGSGELVFYVRLAPEDYALKSFLLNLEQTRELQIQGPLGKCFYRDPEGKEIIMLAGGTGIAPMKSMIDFASEDDVIHLFWGVEALSELFLHDYFLGLEHSEEIESYVPVISGHEPWGGASGWVHQEVLEHFPDLSEVVIYASGPYEMVSEAMDLYLRYGLDPKYFYTDML